MTNQTKQIRLRGREALKMAEQVNKHLEVTQQREITTGPVGAPRWLFKPKIKQAVFVIPENPWR